MNTAALWLRGLAAAFIGGGSTAVSGAITLGLDDSKDYNLGNPAHLLKIMGTMFVISGALSAFAYLKQSPIPAVPVQQDTKSIAATGGQ